MPTVPKTITDLPVASQMNDDDLLVVSQSSLTSSIKGALIKSYAQNAVGAQVTAAQQYAQQASSSATQADSARQGAASAQAAAEAAQSAAESAKESAESAEASANASSQQAQEYAGQANQAKTDARQAQAEAEEAATAAQASQTAAETAKKDAEASATSVEESANTAQQAVNASQAAQNAAEAARNEAETSAASAANSASDASRSKEAIENLGVEGETLLPGQQVTVTKSVSQDGTVTLTFGIPQGIQGDKGDTGETGATGPQGVSVTNATVSENGDLVITLSAGGPINAGSVIGPQGVQGEVGPTGASVDRIERTSGTGAPGTTDTYTVYLTDGKTGGTFQVYNGSNGTGSGDFMADGSVPMIGNLQMGGNKVINMAPPTESTDGATKGYVDSAIEGVEITTDASPTQGSTNPVQSGGVYTALQDKQEKLTGQAGQVVGFDADGNAVAQPAPDTGVTTFNGRTGAVTPQSGDYTAGMVGARPDTWTPSAADVGAISNPPSGIPGQVLTKTSTGEEWSDAPSGLPEGGTEGQVIKKTVDGAEWDNADWLPLSGGTLRGDLYTTFEGQADGRKAGICFGSGGVTYREEVSISQYVKVNARGPDSLEFSGNIIGGDTDEPVFLRNIGTPNTDDTLYAANVEYVNTKLSAKLTTPTGTAGQYLGFTANNTVGAVDAPEPGLTQEQADERYLQLTGGTISGSVYFNDGVGEEQYPNIYADKGVVTIYTPNGYTDIIVAETPTASNQPTSKAYVDSKSPTPFPVTLTTSGWSSNTQTVTVPGVVASETAQLITPIPANASRSAYYEAGIMCTGQAANSLTFTCQTVPTSNLTVYVVIQPLG